jgi:catechol 2,3-dioxygenase-like lactoylglutathione lyase family enzyme
MDHVGIVFNDLASAKAFFVELGLKLQGAQLVGEVENDEDIYRLCYVRGPEGIIVEVAEQIG